MIEWFKNGKTWFPNVDVSKWWDSGNTGANTAGENNPTSPEESVVVKGKAAKLQSTWIGFIGMGHLLQQVCLLVILLT